MTRRRQARLEQRLRSCGLKRPAREKLLAVLALVKRERPLTVAQAQQLIARAVRS